MRASNEARPNVVVQDLAMTSPISWTINEEQLKSNNTNFDEKTGAKGPISVMAVSTYTPPETGSQVSKDTSQAGNKPEAADKISGDEKSDKKPKKARIVVIGSSQVASNKFFQIAGKW